MQHLLLVHDDNGERAVELHAASSSIGRDPRNSIVLHSREVSRQHAILLRVTQFGKEEHEFRLIDGNLQGKPSTNGLFINGQQRTSHTLRHGDEVVFGVQVEARYFQVGEGTDIEWLMSGGDAAVDYMSTMVCASAEPIADEESDQLDESVLARFASFPELFTHPIIEIALTGEITYINPAAVKQFPDIQSEKTNHPVLSGIIETVKANQEEQSVREITVGDHIYEQSLSYIRQSDLIRSYLVEITDRRRAEDDLKALHDRLESEVEERTLQFHEASKRLKREEQALLASYATNRALLNAIPDPMFRIDRNGNFVNFKTPKHHTLPFDPKMCLHRHLSEIFPTAAVAIEACIHQALNTDEMQMMEFQMPAGETSLYFEARIAISAPDEVVMITRDITERKRGEAEIRTALERERELNGMKTRFVSMTSHEFRTPLTTIMSSAELLEHYRERWDVAKQVQYLRKIQTSAKHMTGLLNDVLLINKAEAGKAEFKPQDTVLEEFCQEIVEELQITTAAHELVMRSHIPATPIPLDPKLMRHILTNLLSNAINYSPSGGEILLTLEQVEDTVELRVKDCGIGMPEEARPTLFESFVRGSNVGTISGTGLGLAIVKKSVDLHQGFIDCESKEGEGTTFIVRLPLSLPPVESQAMKAEALC